MERTCPAAGSASVIWKRTSADFTYDTYNRAHEVRYKSGAIAVPSSSAPAFKGDADRVDPEEAFVASLSACHMLTFLAICARKRITVESYEDDAVGFLEKDGTKLWMTLGHVEAACRALRPGTEIPAAKLAEIHHKSHEECFIANSVKTDVTVVPQF